MLRVRSENNPYLDHMHVLQSPHVELYYAHIIITIVILCAYYHNDIKRALPSVILYYMPYGILLSSIKLSLNSIIITRSV